MSTSFFLQFAFGLTYVNWVRVKINGVAQAPTAKFLLSPQWTPWNDYHNIMWAHYPDGFYDLLRKSGVDATITAGDNGLSPILNNNFDFYVEQMAWEVFSIYHKDQSLWRGLIAKFSTGPRQSRSVGPAPLHQRSRNRQIYS